MPQPATLPIRWQFAPLVSPTLINIGTMLTMIAQPHPVDQDIFIIEADESINDDLTESVVNELIETIRQRHHRKVILDCTRLEFLSSFGLSLMLRLRHAVNGNKGELKISGLSVVLEQILEMSKVGGLFKCYFDVDAARMSFLSERSRSM